MNAVRSPTAGKVATCAPPQPSLIALAQQMAPRLAGAYKFQVLLYRTDRTMSATWHYCPACLPHIPYRSLAELGVTVSVSRVAPYHPCAACGQHL